MPHVVTTQGVVLTVPALDGKGNPVKEIRKFGNREVEVEVVDHQRYDAETVIEVDEETATELLSAKLARPHHPELDPEIADQDALGEA